MQSHPDLSSYLPVKNVLSGEEGFVEHDDIYDHGPSISAYAPIAGTGWGIILTTDPDIAYQPMQGYMLQLLGVVAIFIAGPGHRRVFRHDLSGRSHRGPIKDDEKSIIGRL